MVALLAEGVGRNRRIAIWSTSVAPSPSSRRAWVEIATAQADLRATLVALLAEGVGRNTFAILFVLHQLVSPSSRRAWVEII